MERVKNREFLGVQCLGLLASIAGGTELITGQGTKTLQAIGRGQKKKKNEWKTLVPTSTLSPEKVTLDLCPSGSCLKSNQWIFLLVCPRNFSSYCLCAETQNGWVCMWAFQGWSLGFPQSSSSPGHKILWFSKLDIMGVCLPSACPLGWGAQHGAWTPRSSWGTSEVVVSLLVVGYHTRVWFLTRPHLCASYTSRCGLFFISLVVENLFC